jgi:hypothetical protein
MDALERFVCDQNVAQFRDLLTTEMDAARRAVLLKLLVAEECKLGFDVEQLANTDREIGRCRGHVERQRTLVAEMERDGRETARASLLLETLTESLAAHEQHRRRICDRLEQSRL